MHEQRKLQDIPYTMCVTLGQLLNVKFTRFMTTVYHVYNLFRQCVRHKEHVSSWHSILYMLMS